MSTAKAYRHPETLSAWPDVAATLDAAAFSWPIDESPLAEILEDEARHPDEYSPAVRNILEDFHLLVTSSLGNGETTAAAITHARNVIAVKIDSVHCSADCRGVLLDTANEAVEAYEDHFAD